MRGKNPKAVIIDGSLSIPRSAQILRRPPHEVIFATTVKAPKARRRKFSSRGHTVLLCRSTAGGRVFLPHLLRQLGAIGIISLLVEGGGQLFADLFRRKLVDRIVACIAPKIIGGEGMDFLPGITIGSLTRAIELRDVHFQNFGNNIIIEGRPL